MPRRNTTIRDRHRSAIRQGEPACAICGDPIDYDLPHDDDMSYVVDHRVPLAHGGPDTLANKQAAHKGCNLTKGARPGQAPVRRCASLIWP